MVDLLAAQSARPLPRQMTVVGTYTSSPPYRAAAAQREQDGEARPARQPDEADQIG